MKMYPEVRHLHISNHAKKARLLIACILAT